jgi:hypothetical protein
VVNDPSGQDVVNTRSAAAHGGTMGVAERRRRADPGE